VKEALSKMISTFLAGEQVLLDLHNRLLLPVH
jgi:hypothetical protein